jgi:hypothetical protein
VKTFIPPQGTYAPDSSSSISYVTPLRLTPNQTKAGNWANTRDTARLRFRLSHAFLLSPATHVRTSRLRRNGSCSIARSQATPISRQPCESPSCSPCPIRRRCEHCPLASSPLSKAALRHTPYDSPASYDPAMTGHDWLRLAGLAYPFLMQRRRV